MHYLKLFRVKARNPLRRKLKVFLTNDSISEFSDTDLKNLRFETNDNVDQYDFGFEDLDIGFRSFVREENDLVEMKTSLSKKLDMPRRRFDFVIGNPPYISYNECSKQGVLIFERMKNNMVKLSNIYGANLHSAPDRQEKNIHLSRICILFS